MKLLARDSIRIVHVDDDKDFAELSARGLRRAGFSQPVVRCADGLRARDYFSTVETPELPDVILLDLNMPGMNGLEVLSWVRQSYRARHVAVVLLTSSEDAEHQKRAAADGVAAYVLKSSLVDELIQKLDGLIALSNQGNLETSEQMDDAFESLVSQRIHC